ncbi:adenylate/guanylate cyclase domain-containing protein [Nocardioides aurantiacus]|uniref:Class 3 adenylate cyclase n=1 Tax=Nocardioides aurantiacus TaxID=86796 RepID=A0A3N2CQM6_9ACTN|nr:adenylate/guanylate cyclase domain-containing protein [Nocardioides aurantiacus]ROR89789.1 class 3 adenylate cyclase [Nocardioides aurantiacus]
MSASAWVAVLLGVLLVGTAIALLDATRRLREARDELERVRDQATSVAVEERPRAVQAAGAAMRTAMETVTRLREQGVRGMLVSSIEDLTAWALEDRTEIVRVADEDGNVTIMFSDIEGSTALNDELGDEVWLKVLQAHDKLLSRCFDQHRGHIVKSAGDGYMVVFSTPQLGIAAALDVQRALERERVPRALRQHPVRVRIGLHTGRAVERDGDWFGRNVAMAARVANTAEGGEVLVSTELAARLKEDVGDDLAWTLQQTEPVTLKGLPGEHTLWQVSA